METSVSGRVWLAAAALTLCAACTESPRPDANAGGKLNPNANTTSAGSGDDTADDPKSGMNTTRPDSSKDLKTPE